MKIGVIASALSSLLCALLPLSGNAADAGAPNPNLIAFPPFRLVNNVYYVGSQDQSSYLISTPKGLILINSGYAASVPLIEQSVQKLGFKFGDIKILLISHAHIDHDAGSAAILQKTGAKYEVMDADASVVETGGKTDFQNGKLPEEQYAPAHVDRVLHDNDKVELGGTTLTAHLTAGHTKGCTTWTFDEKQDGRTLHVLVLCGVASSAGANGAYKLLDNPDYPQIRSDFEHSFAVYPTLPCDVFLGAHGRYFNLKEKYEKLQAGDKNAFVDPDGYEAYVANAKQAFERQLKKQLDAAKPPGT
jgi:metallo-beta-lactamase class B